MHSGNYPSSFTRRKAPRSTLPKPGVDADGQSDPKWQRIPIGIRAELTRYIEHRIAPGDFLAALLAGELWELHQIGDDESREALPFCAYWIYRYAPPGCFGERYKVNAWLCGVGSVANRSVGEIAEGHVLCRCCKADPGEPCIGNDGLTASGVHVPRWYDARGEFFQKVMTPQGSAYVFQGAA